ncbi:MAG: FGGY-family carbohydrate kinase [Bacteroidales bacterium]
MPMLFIGLDIGSSSIKGSLFDAAQSKILRRVRFPEKDMLISSPAPGMAEQDPDLWWQGVRQVIQALMLGQNSAQLKGIGIIYQMHGLVCVDENLELIRPAIIWCDSRAIDIGREAKSKLPKEIIQNNTLNIPGNLTASKLAWVKKYEPENYKQIYKILLPGDYIATKLSNECTTTESGLSEMALWDFNAKSLSDDLINYFDFSPSLIPEIKHNVDIQARVSDQVAKELNIEAGTPISFRAGDQVGNAFALNVVNVGEAACNAGTSGVLYGVHSNHIGDLEGRFNSLLHAAPKGDEEKLGYLLCINGCGILYSWLRNNLFPNKTYDELNQLAENASNGIDDLFVFPYGNGAERSLYNKIVGGHFSNIDFNRHSINHLLKASIEGIAFSFRLGLDILNNQGIHFDKLKAPYANLMKSDFFTQTLTDITEIPIERSYTEGADGAARGAAVGSGNCNLSEVFSSLETQALFTAKHNSSLQEKYEEWKEKLMKLS